MGTPALGVPVSVISNPHWLSERSATKLAFAEQGTLAAELAGDKSSIATAQPVSLDPMIVPNTILSGLNAGASAFSVDAFDVLGSLDSAGQVDLYEFRASAGDLFNVEVMSRIIDQRISDTLDTQISVLDSTGSLINYYGGPAFNDDELETLDSILIDLIIPADGTYYMQVNAYSASDIGGYELFAYRFNGGVQILGGDFDGDGDYSCNDVDSLVLEISLGTNGSNYDVTGDGLVNGADLTAWLAEAGGVELASGNPYLPGDANLDGTVDGVDFVTWNAAKFTATPAWCSGDFDASGFVDGVDFVVWNANKFQTADVSEPGRSKHRMEDGHLIYNSDVSAVPEPTSGLLMLLSVLALAQFTRKR